MYLEKCSPDQLRDIYEELNITEASLKRDVAYLIEWMEKTPHLPNVKDETLISHFLIQCKNSLEKAKKKIDSYYSVKASLPHLFTNCDPIADEFKTTYNIIAPLPLPKLTPEGYRIVIFKILQPGNSHLLTADTWVKSYSSLALIGLKDDCFKKIILIYDFENITTTLIYTIFEALRKYIVQNQAAYVNRIHESHLLLRMNSTVLPLFNIIKSLLKKKLADRLTLWSNEKPDLLSMFPAEIIPEEYGGKEKSIKKLHEEYYEYVCSFREWLKSEEEYTADLSKRTDNLYKVSDSMDGSFRKLAID